MQQIHALAKELGCHWLELVVDDAIVANTEGEIRRLKAMRELDPGDLAEIDAFLEFKRARKK